MADIEKAQCLVALRFFLLSVLGAVLRDAGEERLAVLLELVLADALDEQHLLARFRQDGTHVLERRIGEDDVGRDVVAQRDLFAQCAQVLEVGISKGTYMIGGCGK